MQKDEEDAQKALKFIQPDKTITFNIQPAVDTFNTQFEDAIGDKMTDFNKGNAKARMRMITQYAIAGQEACL
ncbi:NAD synthetase [Mesobacillus boroniphilus JCM 21738]|uniref:NAD synthetase n=1 Tax=Mesobacillus boroniphilus JCM 21738 TaxID=1294265 RepID=W4RTK3_9BACI|nr:NAD synthetase [Mesobacillus boroniphilus JCM 21738]